MKESTQDTRVEQFINKRFGDQAAVVREDIHTLAGISERTVKEVSNWGWWQRWSYASNYYSNRDAIAYDAGQQDVIESAILGEQN